MIPERGPHPLSHYLNHVVRAAAGDPDGAARIERFLTAVRAYQQHPYRRAMDTPPVVARRGTARVLDYAPPDDRTNGTRGPVALFVPSLVNPPWVLDLSPDNSLLRWLACQGVRPMLLDWGEPGPDERQLDLGGYVRERLLPLIAALDAPVTLVGYCLGGTLCVAAAALSPHVVRLATLAAPWAFSLYGEAQRANLASYWTSSKPLAQSLGVLPMESLQLAFWSLDPDLMERKFARFGTLDPASPEAENFVALEDWANAGPPLSLPAAIQCFERFFRDDDTGQDRWRIGDTPITPEALRLPSLVIVSNSDRLVPRPAAAALAERLPGATLRSLDAGHVGMIVGTRARGLLWEPLRDWLLAPGNAN